MNYVAIDHITPVLKRVVPGCTQVILTLLRQHEVKIAQHELDFMRSPSAGLCRLTDNEKTVCNYLLKGKSYKEIAALTNRKYAAVVNNGKMVLQKTGTHSRLQLVFWLRTNMSTTFPD